MIVPPASALGPASGASPLSVDPTLSSVSTGEGAPATSFGTLVSQGMEAVNQQLVGSEIDLQRLATGDAQNLHQIMIRLEETRLSFQLFMQVRNRVLEAYQDIMKMQV